MADLRFAVIKNGTVVNAIVAPESFVLEGFNLIASDTAQFGQLWDGSVFTDAPQEPEPLPNLTMRQFRLGLLSAGLLDDVESAVAAMPGDEGKAARIEFEYAVEVIRTAPLVSALAAVLGITDEQVDALWLSAVGR